MAAIAMPTPALMSTGESPSAKFVAEQYQRGWQSLEETHTFGRLSESVYRLREVFYECNKEGWDGYDSAAVSPMAIEAAWDFLKALPLGAPAPSVSAEPDGHVTLEWYQSPVRTISVSVSPEGSLHYAALFGASKQYGTEPFYGRVPESIIEPIYRVMGA